MRHVSDVFWKTHGASSPKERHSFCFERQAGHFAIAATAQERRFAAKTRSLSRATIATDQKWTTGPISHVQVGTFVKVS